MLNQQTAALRTDRMIGRQKQLNQVKAAIKESKKASVFFIYGIGGIGKTRLLEEIGDFIKKDLKPDEAIDVRWSGIIDLYHSDMHSNSRIEERIVANLDPEEFYFSLYQKKRREFQQQRAAGLVGSVLEEARNQLTEAFVNGFEQLSRDYRVVLTFDTLELVQYESEFVQEVCQIEERSTSVKNWLLEQISKFKNTVTVFAGRPHPFLQKDFDYIFSKADCNYQSLPIVQFSRSEARKYLKQITAQRPELYEKIDLDDETFEIIFRGAENGRPVYISLALDLLSFGDDIGEIFLVDVPPDDPQRLEKMQQGIVKRLLNLEEPYGDIVHYLAIARQGLDKPLLRYLVDESWSDRRIDEAIEQMQSYTFIKTRPQQTDQLFLHDEVYDLLDRYHLDFRPDVEPNLTRVVDYYKSQREEIQLAMHRLKDLPWVQQAVERETLLRKLADVSTMLLYYALQLDPQKGYYHYYCRWVEEAIKGHLAGYDMRLRDVVLGFLNYLKAPESSRKIWLSEQLTSAEIDRNSVLHWMRRYLVRNNYDRVCEIAAQIRESDHPNFAWNSVTDPLYKAGLLTIWGEALVYTSATREAMLANPNEAIGILTDDSYQWPVDEDDDPKDELWRRWRTLGRANNNIGYAYRRFNQLRLAVDYYREAIRLYRQVDILDEMADTGNNLAYVYARLGAIDEAIALSEGAMGIRRELGQRYPLGLSMNTRGIVALEADQPHQARAFATQALEYFQITEFEDMALMSLEEPIGYKRGQALAYLTLSEALRMLANLYYTNVYDHDDAFELIKEGRRYLSKSIDFFSKYPEDVYAIQTNSEMGRLYRDWLRLIIQTKENHDQDPGKYDLKPAFL